MKELNFADRGRWGNQGTAGDSVEMKARNWPRAEIVGVGA